MSKARNLSDFISDPTISSTEIADQAVTHAKLHTTMDLSSKTVTLPTLNQSLTLDGPDAGVAKLRLQAEEVHGDIEGINIGNNFGGLAFKTNNNGTVAERVRIDNAGNVGIGTTSPARQLSIVDDGTNGQAIMEVIDSTNNNVAGIFLGRANNTNIGGIRYFHSTNYLALRSNDEDALIINSSGNVGIGTESPSVNLEVSDSGNSFILVKNTSSGSGLYIKADTDGDAEIQTAGGNNNLVMRTSGQERMRIDSSGNLLVGKTTGSLAPNGAAFFTSGQSDYSSDAAYISKFNKKGADGTILEFRKDTTTVVGNIGVESSDNLTIGGTVANHSGLLFGTNTIIPMQAGSGSDATQDLGNSGSRFKDAYLSGGVYLGGTGSANKLDDYEEGTWTPTIAGLNNTPTYYNNYGKYTKVGRKVTIQFFQQTNSPPTFSNNSAVFRITGIPFTCDGSGYTGSQGSMNSQGFHFNGSSNNQFATGQVAASVGNDGGLALSFSVTHSGGTRGLVNNGAAGSGYIIEATVTYFTTQ